MFKCSHGTPLNNPCILCDKEYADEEYQKNNNLPTKVLLCDPSTWKVGNTISLISARSQLLVLEK